MKFQYLYLQIFIHLLIAFIFLSEILKPTLPLSVYNFVSKNRETIFGLYYIYLSYELFKKV